jgi:hypothetical protein
MDCVNAVGFIDDDLRELRRPGTNRAFPDRLVCSPVAR